MKNYRVVSNKKTILESIDANSTAEVGVLVAVEFGDLYFGCQIIENVSEEVQKERGYGPDFHCVSVKRSYENKNVNPIIEAAKSFNLEIRYNNDLYESRFDHEDGELFSFPHLILG